MDRGRTNRGPVRAIWLQVDLVAADGWPYRYSRLGPVGARSGEAGDVVAVDAAVAGLSWVDSAGEFAPYDLGSNACPLVSASRAQRFDNR